MFGVCTLRLFRKERPFQGIPACLLEWGFRASRPKSERIGKIQILASPENREEKPKIGKWLLAQVLGAVSYFLANFSCFLGEAKTNIFPNVFLFQAERPENSAVAGGQGPKPFQGITLEICNFAK